MMTNHDLLKMVDVEIDSRQMAYDLQKGVQITPFMSTILPSIYEIGTMIRKLIPGTLAIIGTWERRRKAGGLEEDESVERLDGDVDAQN